MKVAPEYIFPGARVKLGEEDYFIIKVNAKSFYATTMNFSEYTELFNKRAKGTTFTAFCKAHGINQYKYSDGFEIEETAFNKQDIAETDNSYKLEKIEKDIIIGRISDLRKRKKSIKFSSLFEVNKKRVFFLEENGNNFLANINNDYVLFSIDTDKWIKISTVYDYSDKYKSIPWEKLEELTEKVEVTA